MRTHTILGTLLILPVFALGIIVGIVAFKDDWGVQASKADSFLGGETVLYVHLH
jgi:hypothetical protein